MPQPTNIFLGDPLLSSPSLDNQLAAMRETMQRLEAMKAQMPQIPQQSAPQPPQQQPRQRLLWDEIDSEVSPLTDEQKARLFQNEDYAGNYNILQNMVQSHLLDLVKGRIEQTQDGKEILTAQLKIVRKLKSKVVEDTNREMDMFRRFREFSKTNPEVTYEQFIKSQMQ